MDKALSLKINKDQAWFLRNATEACARLGIGQCGNALETLVNKDGRYCFFPYDVTSMVEKTLAPLIRMPPGVTGGIGRHPDCNVLWDLYQVIRNRIAWDQAIEEGITNADGTRNWGTMMAVYYDDPLKMGHEPLARIAHDGEGYALEVNQAQAELIVRAIKTCIEMSVGRYEMAVMWPKSTDGDHIPEDSREYFKGVLEMAAITHIEIGIDDRKTVEESPHYANGMDVVSQIEVADFGGKS